MRWTAGASNGASIAGFRIEWRVSGSNGSWSGSNAGSSATQETITGLQPGTTYAVRVRATVATGTSGRNSDWATATGTTSQPPPPKPAAPTITVSANSDTELGVSWTAGAANGATVSGFRIQWRVSGSSENWSSSNAGAAATGTTLTNLQPSTTYAVRVRTLVTTGQPSDWATATGTTSQPPPPPKPAAPTITVSANSDTALTVSWTAGASNGASIAGFRIEWRVSGSHASWAGSDAGAAATGTTLTNLQPSTTYAVRVKTRVTTGTRGIDSDWATATGTTLQPQPPQPPQPTPTPPKPAAPTINSVSAQSDTALSVRWTAGASNGATVSGFRIEWRVSGSHASWSGSNAGATDTQTAITNLQPATTYAVRVRTLVTTGEPSDWATSTGTTLQPTPPQPTPKPDAPTINSVSASSDTVLTVSWTAGAANGATVAGFRIEWRVSGSHASWSGSDAGAGDTQTALTNLQPGTTYAVRVRTLVTTGLPSDWATATGTTSQTEPPSPPQPQPTPPQPSPPEPTPVEPPRTLSKLSAPGHISFSELMLTSEGGARSLPQWIELYNNSNTTPVNLWGWTLEIEAHDADGSYRRGVISLEDLPIPPNQTALIVTWTGRNSGDFPADRLYNFFTHHSDAFEQNRHRNMVLGQVGFSLKLLDPDGVVSDVVGNLDGRARTADAPSWQLPAEEIEGGARASLMRRYNRETRVPFDGRLSSNWMSASALQLKVVTYWGRRTDIGNPGYRGEGAVPVQLSSLRAERLDTGGVVIQWTTASELENAGFNILRSRSQAGPYVKVNPALITGAGTTSERYAYTYRDSTAQPNTAYFYHIEDVSFSGMRQRLATTRMRGHLSASGKLSVMWGGLKTQH